MSKKANFFAIGVFVTIAAVLACFTVVIFGSGILRRDTQTLLATFQGSASGLTVGSKVKAYGVEIGEVEQVLLHAVPDENELVIPVLFNVDRARFHALIGTYDYQDDDDGADDDVDRGVHAQLKTASVVTGQVYIDLAYGLDPGEGYVLESSRFKEYVSIPTVPTDLELFVRALESIIRNLEDTDIGAIINDVQATTSHIRNAVDTVDFAGIGEDIHGLVTDTRTKLNSPEAEKMARDFIQLADSLSQVSVLMENRAEGSMDKLDASLEQLRASLEQVEETTRSADSWLSPDSAIYDEAVTALDRMSDASDSLRMLIDFIERNPNAFLTGRKVKEDK